MSLASRLGERFRAEFLSKLVEILTGVLLTVGLARLLEPDEYGLLFLAISILSIFKILSTFGISKSGGRYISEYKEMDLTQIPHIILDVFLLLSISITVTCIIVIVTYKHIAMMLGEPELSSLLFAGTLFIIFSTILNGVKGILWGFEAIKSKSIIHAIDRGLRPFLAIGFVFLGYGALGALGGYILAAMVPTLVGIPYIYIRFYINKNGGSRKEGLRRQIAKYSVPLVASNASRVLDNRVDVLLVAFFINPTAVAFYTVSKQVVSSVISPVKSLGVTLGPTFQAQIAKGNPDTAARMYEEALSHGLLLYIPAVAGLVIIAHPTIKIIFGDQYLGAVPVLQVLALWMLLRSITAITGQALDFLGRARHRAIVYGITAFLNVLMNIILIPLLGVVGAAIATVITYGIYMLAIVYIITTELDIKTRLLFQYVVKSCMLAVIMAVPVYFLNNYVTDILTLFLVVAIGAGIWLGFATRLGYLNLKQIVGNLT